MMIRERFGLPFAFILLAAASWYYVTNDVREDVILRHFSPFTWLSIFPYGDIPSLYLASFPAPWPLWIEGVILFVTWTLIFMVLRGGYYALRSAGDLSMWQIFGFCIVLGIVLATLLMIPVLNQIELWKASW